MRQRKGATLIEVLIVVFVLVVVFGITFGIRGCYRHSRWGSRLSGNALELKLPDNFSQMVNVSISGDGRKNLTYLDVEGNYRTKEYTDSGWLEGEIIWLKPKSK